MKWSYEWLKEYLDTDLTPEQVADKLNAVGLEVEDLHNPILPIAAKIVECAVHPNSDHLHVLKVDDGSKQLRQIVCGAPNVRIGLIGVLAPVGCVLPNTKKPITKRSVDGIESNGMMCSAAELAVGTDSDTIIELDKNEQIGTKYKG